jgi:hypothetical protein
VVFSPLLWVVLKWGPGWRDEKVARDEGREVSGEVEKGKIGGVEAMGEILGRSEEGKLRKSE